MSNKAVKCICLSEKERRESDNTGYVKLFHFEPGYDEDDNPCPIHDPRKKNMSDETLDQAQSARRDRGEQLRALVISWNEEKTFLFALNEQQRAIEEGSFGLNDDWCVMADEILGAFLSQPKMDCPDEKEEAPQDEVTRIILP